MFSFVRNRAATSEDDEASGWNDHSSDTGDGEDDSSWSEDASAKIDGDDESGESDGRRGREGKYTCSVCGMCLHKPALLKQHMASHSDKRPYACPVENCGKSYKRQDHLNRHSLTHQGKLFMCPVKGCDVSFTMSSNLQRHVGLHEKWDSELLSGQKGVASDSLKCPEPCCGKKFKYPSLLQTHMENVHESMVVDQVVCMEPGCGEVFADVSQLQAHRKLSHCHVICDVCGLSMLRRQLKMHILLHTGGAPRIQCPHPGCLHTYSSKSNLDTHIRAVHLDLKPYKCSQCTMRTPYKVVRDKHEAVVHSQPSEVVDFEAEDIELRMRPRGGRKRVMIQHVDDLFTKRSAFKVLSDSSGRKCQSC